MPVQESVGEKDDPPSRAIDSTRKDDFIPEIALKTTKNQNSPESEGCRLPETRFNNPISNVDNSSEVDNPQHEPSQHQEETASGSSGFGHHVDENQDVKCHPADASTRTPMKPVTESPGKEKDLYSNEPNRSTNGNQPIQSTATAEALLMPNGSAIVASAGVSGWSHQVLAPKKVEIGNQSQDDEWQDMPSYARYDLYDDDGKLIAREEKDSGDEGNAYAGLGGAGKGYTRVQIDEDARSATSMDDNTNYLFKPKGTDVADEDEEQRDPLAQMQATKNLLTEGQRIAYVGVTRLAMIQMDQELDNVEGTKNTKKEFKVAVESMKMWSQQMMLRLYAHMEINPSGIWTSF